eukprot:1478752-Rhodomonas_salina.4
MPVFLLVLVCRLIPQPNFIIRVFAVLGITQSASSTARGALQSPGSVTREFFFELQHIHDRRVTPPFEAVHRS